MLNKKRFIEGIGSGVFAIILKTGLSIWIYPVSIQMLGAELFGLAAILFLIFEVNSIVQNSIGQGIVRLLGEYRAREDEENVTHILWIGKIIFSVIAAIMLIAGLVIAPMTLGALGIPERLHDVATFALRLLALDSTMQFICGFLAAIIKAHYQFKWLNVGELFFHLGTQVLSLIALYSGFGIIGLAAVNVLITSGRVIFYFNRALAVEPNLFKAKAERVRVDDAKRLGHFTFASLILHLCVFIGMGIDGFVIARFLDLKSVAVFDIVFKIMSFCPRIPYKMCEVLFPAFNQLLAVNAQDELRLLFLRMSHVSVFFSGLMLIAVIGTYEPIFRYFSAGQVSIDNTIWLVVITAAIQLSSAMIYAVNDYLYANNRQMMLSVSSIVAAVTNLGLSIFFVQWLGLPGVLLGTLIPTIIQHHVIMQSTALKLMEISIGGYIRTVLAPSMLPWVVATVWVVMTRLVFVPSDASLPVIAIGTGTTVGLGLLAWARYSADATEKGYVVKIFNKLGLKGVWVPRLLAMPAPVPVTTHDS